MKILHRYIFSLTPSAHEQFITKLRESKKYEKVGAVGCVEIKHDERLLI